MHHDYKILKGGNKVDGKFKKPFAITCKKCGGNDIVVTAFEYQDLGIRCRDCGSEINCQQYYTKKNT